MDPRQLSEFKRLIENSQEIALIPSLDTKGEALLSSLALLFSLDNFNRKTSLLLGSLPASAVALDSANIWQNKPTIIINNPSGEKVSQLKYEKNNGRVYLHFNSHDIPLKEEDVIVSFSPFTSAPDLFICLGFSGAEEISHPLFRQRKDQATIVDISCRSENEGFGRLNLTSSENSLAEITAGAIESLDESLIDRRVGAYLLKGLRLYAASREFSDRLCRRIAQLVNQEALSYSPNPCTSEDVGQLTFLEKALKRLEFYPHKNLAVLTIPYHESQDTDPNDLVFVIDELRSKLLELGNFIVLWQPEHNSTQGIIYLEEKEKLDQVASLYPGQYHQGRGTFVLYEENPEDVKNKIVNYLLSL